MSQQHANSDDSTQDELERLLTEGIGSTYVFPEERDGVPLSGTQWSAYRYFVGNSFMVQNKERRMALAGTSNWPLRLQVVSEKIDISAFSLERANCLRTVM